MPLVFKLFLDFTDLLGRILPMLMASMPLLTSKSFGNGKEFVSSHPSFFFNNNNILFKRLLQPAS